MGAGCLSPKPRIGQIYIDCINSIYQEVKTIQKISDFNIYEDLKNKILKKGLLKKLMDYLQCHRSMISEALLHNYRIMVQCKNINCKLTGLIITDYIIGVILKKTNSCQRSFVSNLFDKDSYSIYQSSQIKKEQTFKNVSIVNTSSPIFNYKQQSQKQNQDPQFKYPQHSFVQQSSDQLLKQIKNIKFTNIYFSMLKELLQIDEIFQSSVESILVYGCINSSKSIFQQPVVEIMKVLLQNIKKNNHLLKCLKCYYILLQKLKDTNVQKQIKNIGYFFQLQNQLSNQSNNQNLIQPQSQIEDLLKSKIIIQKIISKLISLSTNMNSLNQIYHVILTIYDEKKFMNMQYFQGFFMSATKNEDYKSKFFRGLFCELLCYFSVCKSQQQNPLYNWSKLSINKPIDYYISNYPNIFYKQVKKQVINTLRRWVKQLYFVDINNIIRYNLYLFLYSFDFNVLNSKDGLLNEFIISQFLQMCLYANFNQKIMIINALFQQLRQVRKPVNLKIFDINIIESLLQSKMTNQLSSKNNIINDNEKLTFHFCPCDSNNQLKVNQKILQIFKKIIKQYGLTSSSIVQIDQVCYFLYSIYQFVSNNTYPLQQYWKILQDIQKVFKQLQNQKAQLIILAFCQRILKAQKIDSDNINLIKVTQFSCILIAQILNNSKLANRTKYRKTINKISIWTVKINQLKQNVQKLSLQQLYTQVQKVQKQIFSQQVWLDQLQIPEKQQFLISTEEKFYQNASIVFRDMFQRGVSVINCKFKSTGDQIFGQSSRNIHTNRFSRINSVIQIQNVGDQDKSIKDIMEMIHI